MILSAFMLLMTLMTNVVSNNAAAVIGTPIAISIAQQLGVDDPTPFILAVLFGANMSFATPYGYQTNLLISQCRRLQVHRLPAGRNTAHRDYVDRLLADPANLVSAVTIDLRRSGGNTRPMTIQRINNWWWLPRKERAVR